MLIAVVVLLVAIGVGVVLIRKNKSTTPPVGAGSTTEAPSQAPTPTPVVDKMSVTIQVLNGTGTPGQATKVATSLKNAGYNPDNIKTGNASDAAASSSIAAKAGFEGVANDMVTALSSDFPDISVSSTPLDDSSTFDIVVTTGGQQYVAPTPTPDLTDTDTPTPTPSTTDTPTPTPTITDTPTPTPGS